ncbi:MAG: leucine-rich repeat protein [Lachnospiraceae bacterium]|nr:leucine-rich repeat protein [Lachnospiraceae bacterium]
MRRKTIKTKLVALGLATAMALSVITVPYTGGYVQAAEAGTVVTLYENETSVNIAEEAVTFEEEQAEWANKKEVTYAYTNNDKITLPADYTLSVDVTLDDDGYNSLADDEDYLKIQGVVKGSTWNYLASPDIKELTQADFSEGKTTRLDISFTEMDPDELYEIDFVAIGQGFKGMISFSNVKVTSEAEPELDYDSLKPAFNCSFTNTKDWDQVQVEKEDAETGETKKVNVEYSTGISLSGVPKEGAVVSATVLVKSQTAPAYEGGIQFKGVMRLGDNWNYVASQDYNYTSAEAFKAVEGHEGWYAADVAWSFGAKVEAWYGSFKGATDFAEAVTENLSEFTVECAGANSDFTGDIYIINPKFTDGTVLVEQEDKVVADFSTDPGKSWASEKGYLYHHGDANATNAELADVSWDEENERLAVGVDFSADSDTGYSEAKVNGKFDAVDISNYNQVTFDLICPEGSTMSKIKFFMNDDNGKNVKDTNVEFKAGEDGKATIAVDFTPKNVTVSALTIGLVGPSIGNGNKGTYYIDNVTFSQSKKDPLEGFVKITEEVKANSGTADITKMPSEVKLVDAAATAQTKALAAYLTGLRESNQVLFGHQNSSFRSVNSNGEVSDIKDITKDEAGVFGIDTLSLTGAEVSVTRADGGTPTKAIEKSVEVSKKAYDAGSIVTLSCHMPNFADTDKIKESELDDSETYPYDFMDCNFNESKDLRNCSALVIQEGTEANKRFKAYLDIIAAYANALAEENVPVLFRPFHENSGGWFWWGTTSTSEAEYKAMWKYMVNYLKNEKDVHNFLYVYSPNGPVLSEAKYLERYPGDAYVDVLAFDYYDDYADVNAAKENNFFDNVAATCQVIKKLADDRNKIPAIAESGIRITGAGKDSLVAKGNPPVLTNREDNGWYDKLIETAVENDIPYFLLWANFDDGNFFIPYKIDATDEDGNAYGHEMINDFIKAYNNPKSIFASGAKFYTDAAKKSVSASEDKYGEEVDGWLVTPNDKAVIKAENLETMKTIKAVAYNASKVVFEVYGADDAKVVLNATKVGETNDYTADLTKANLESLGITGVGKIYAYATGTGEGAQKILIGKAEYINFNQDTPVMAQPLFDNFEYYYGNSGLLASQYGDDNSAAGCDSSVSLDGENKVEGDYGMKFDYKLSYAGSEVWTGGLGRQFDEDKTDYSDYNAITMWVKPDGNGQKIVFQLLEGSAEAEAFLTEFGRGTEAKYVTIPLSAFIKKGSTDPINPANITAYKLWCNSIPENYRGEKDEKGGYVVDSSLYFDDIKAVSVDADILAAADKDTNLIITSKPISECGAADVEALPDYAARDAVEEAIKAIGDVAYTEECKEAIDAAKEAYDNLDASLKALVSKELVQAMQDADATYNKVDAAMKAINAIKDVKNDDASKKAIEAARKAYDALTADQKKLVSSNVLKKLTDAEAAYKKAVEATATEADKKAAADVTAAIEALKDVQYDDASKAAIEAARKAYDALTADQKKLISADTLKKLTDAEATYEQKRAEAESVAAIGTVIDDAASKAKFVVTKSAAGNYEVAYKGTTNKKATKITVPNTVTKDGIVYKVTSISANALKNNKKVTKVTMGSNMVTIGANAFSGCSKLKTVSIGKNVTTIGKRAFNGCKKLKTVSIGKNVNSIGERAFYKCTSITKITIPANVKSIGKEAFSGCKKLKTITIKTKKLTSKSVAKKAFKGVPSKATVKVPKAKLKAYKRLLKSKGLSSKAKIKK